MTPVPGGRAFGGRFRMRSRAGWDDWECAPRSLCAYSAERLFLFRNSGKSADFPELPFHGRGREGKRHLQRRFLRKRGAAEERARTFAGRTLSVIATRCHLPRRGRFCSTYRQMTKSSPFGGAGAGAPERVRSPGGAVAQRLRGSKSAEPEKTVKRSSRRTGVNLQFFPV